jgi:hypothetical protein
MPMDILQFCQSCTHLPQHSWSYHEAWKPHCIPAQAMKQSLTLAFPEFTQLSQQHPMMTQHHNTDCAPDTLGLTPASCCMLLLRVV